MCKLCPSAEAKSIKDEISAIQAELETQRMDLLSPQSDKTLIEGLLSDATLMDQYQKELRNLENEIRNAESELPSSGNLFLSPWFLIMNFFSANWPE